MLVRTMCMFKVVKLENQIIIKILGSNKTKGPKSLNITYAWGRRWQRILFLFVDEFLSSINQWQGFYWTWLWVARTRPISYKKWEQLTLREYLGSPVVFWHSLCCTCYSYIFFALVLFYQCVVTKTARSSRLSIRFSPEFTSIFCLHLTWIFGNRTSIQF